MTTQPPEVPKLNEPIVLAHGLLGFDHIRVAGLKLCSYFRGIPKYLRRSGNQVILTRVPPTASVERRAHTLKRQLVELLPDQRCHLIAHSLGGLDSRFMITHLGMADRVISLTTLSTPHRGSTLADWMTPRLRPVLRFIGMDDQALHDLHVDACARFNERTPDAPDVRYLSVAGCKPRAQMEWPLRWASRRLQEAEGPNDGLVSVYTAKWGESIEIWPCDHVDMVGWRSPIERLLRRSPDVRPLYGSLLRTLRDRGIS